jgi:hypothetical protein
MKVIRKPAGQRHIPEHVSTPWQSAAGNDAQRYSPCISGIIREQRVNVSQVAPVLHQMKLALEEARYVVTFT